MKKLTYIILLNSILLSGCATSHLPKTVDVPIAVTCPKPQIPAKPELPLANLNANDKPDMVVKTYAASIKILDGYNKELIHILESYGNH